MTKKRIKVSSAKAKGRDLQQWVAKMISDLIHFPWGKDEMIASREMGQTGPDIRLVADAREQFPWSVECKRQESWSVHNWVEQAQKNQMAGTDWLIVAKRSHKDPVVILDAFVFFQLLRHIPGKKGR